MNVGACEPVLCANLHSLVIDISIKDYEIRIPSFQTAHYPAQPEAIEEIKARAHQSEIPDADVFIIAQLQVSVRVILFWQHPEAHPGSKPGKHRHIVPEGHSSHPVPQLDELSARSFDLRGLACTVDSGETDNPWAAISHKWLL